MPDNGIVTNQAITIDLATPQLTALIRLEEPTPSKEPLTTCVVLTGKCKNVAVKIVIAEFKSAANPLIVSTHCRDNFPTAYSSTHSHCSSTTKFYPNRYI